MNKKTAIVFFGIIILGLVISLVSLNKCSKPVELSQVKDPVSGEPISKPKSGKGETPKTPGSPKGGSSSPAPKTPGQSDQTEGEDSSTFASPAAAMEALSGNVASQDFDGFLEFVGDEAIPKSIRKKVKALIEDPNFSLSEGKPFSEISKSADSVRWSLNFESKGSDDISELYVDLVNAGENSFEVSKIRLPIDPESIMAGPGGKSKGSESVGAATGSKGNPVKPASNDEDMEKPDALTVAHAFSRAIVNRDFNLARALSDPEAVTDERVAALMIAVEEGKFALKADRPLVVTLSREDITWVLSRVQSDGGASEFALELGQTEGDWRVNGLTFSKVLSALAQQAGGGSVAYSPIVEDPEGGDSLVLYFEFDEGELNSRSSRQLAIVADILSQGPDRVIRINGHADALGSDEYNSVLSIKRADSIRQALISMGVGPNQVVTEAFGETKPRRPNFNPDGTDNPTGRSENRRAEVYLDF